MARPTPNQIAKLSFVEITIYTSLTAQLLSDIKEQQICVDISSNNT
jgi:hypothetical protein